MNVVYLCQRVPYPPDRGDRITTWHFLQHLLDRGATVRVGCFAEEDRDAESVEFLRSRCAAVVAPRLDRRVRKLTSLRGLLTGEALTLPFFRHPELQRAVTGWCQGGTVDLVHVYSSSMAQYALTEPSRAKVMHFAELDSDKWRQYAAVAGPLGRWIYGREHRRLLAFEAQVARTFDASLVVSDVEKDLFERCIPGTTAEVVPNGVDTEHFTTAGDAERHPHTLVFTGVMDYEPNVDGVLWFVAECWPALRREFPDARLLVVGSKPTAAITALGSQPGITVTGRVPTTPPWFDRAAVAIAPLRLARGVQNKVLEAMCMALPVVSSPQAAQGLGPVPDGTLAIADGAEATLAAIRGWFSDPAGARQVGRAAAAWIREHWHWNKVFADYDRLLQRLGVG